MSIRPIDLQTMFMGMNEVSRKQAIAQEAAAHKQAVEDASIAKDSKTNDERVGKIEEFPDGPPAIDNQKPENRRRQPRSRAKLAAAESTKPESETTEAPLRDPDLGNTIDIVG
jgi:hypothetical protein